MITGVAQEDIKKGEVIHLDPEDGKVYLIPPMNFKSSPVAMLPMDEIDEHGEPLVGEQNSWSATS